MKKILLLLFSLAVFLIISEISLAILGLPRFYNYHSTPPQFGFIEIKDGQVVYVNAPNNDINFVYDGNPRGYFDKENMVSHKTNSLGFRGPEFDQQKPQGGTRIALLGDSFTFGEGVRFEDTYAEQLSSQLNKKTGGQRFESLNFGVGGYNSVNELFALENFVLPYNPDIVVLKYDLSEAEPALFKLDHSTNQAVRVPRWYETNPGLFNINPPDKLIFKLRLPRLIWQIIVSRKKNAHMLQYFHTLYRPDSPDWLESEQALRKMIRLCRQRNIRVYVVFFPMLYRLDRYPFLYIHERVGKIVEEEGGAFIDLYPLFKNIPTQKLWVHPTDHHPNEVAHKIAAQALAKTMRK